jgi:outer membrane protein assembly factor BamD (BamD/ComL family)
VPAVEADFDPELRELERARRAVATNPSQALVALRVHGQRYPSSVLSQEREALTVKALVAAGRYAEARAAAASFSQRHPESMLLDSVQNAIRSIP